MKKQYIAFILAIISLVVIFILWFVLLPPDYVDGDYGQNGFFDTLKEEFSNFNVGQ